MGLMGVEKNTVHPADEGGLTELTLGAMPNQAIITRDPAGNTTRLSTEESYATREDDQRLTINQGQVFVSCGNQYKQLTPEQIASLGVDLQEAVESIRIIQGLADGTPSLSLERLGELPRQAAEAAGLQCTSHLSI